MQAPSPILIEHWPGLTPYEDGMTRMDAALAEVLAGGRERLIFCEHTPVLTVGSSGKREDAKGIKDIPVVETGRGGQVTYHGPGQRVVYPVVRLERWGKDVRVYVKWLQNWIVDSLDDIGISSYICDDIGVWIGDHILVTLAPGFLIVLDHPFLGKSTQRHQCTGAKGHQPEHPTGGVCLHASLYLGGQAFY